MRKVSLFTTCVADQFFPEAGFAAARVLQRLGCEVLVPAGQACCGQPAFNAGHWDEARRIARNTLDAFENAGMVVCLAGSCAGMVEHHYPELFKGFPEDLKRIENLSGRLREFSQFLVHDLGVTDVGASFPHRVTFHPSCHASRLLGVKEEPLALLNAVKGLEYIPLPRAEDCCGFGGTFAVKMSLVSEAMVEEKVQHIAETGADFVTSTDLGCLMNIEGSLKHHGLATKTWHLAQVLDQVPSAGRRP